MRLFFKIISVLFMAVFITATANAAEHNTAGAETIAKLEQLISSENRSDEHKARDKYRHPLETLTFTGIEPTMTVVEIWPGGQGSWYRGIIEPMITEGGGTYIPVTEDHDTFTKEKGLPYGEVDMVLVFRAHGFMIEDDPAQPYVDAVYSMLKPGGILAIVDHAGDEAIPQDPTGDNGYVNESHFIMLAEKAGFVLLADTDVNRNPNDTKNYPHGVWSLPPRLKGADYAPDDQQNYLDIGESDRFTLKFYKPEE